MSIYEILKKLPKKDLKKLYETSNTEDIDSLYNKLKERIKIIVNYGTDRELEMIKNILDGKDVQRVSDILLCCYVVYKEKKNFYLTKEALEVFENFNLTDGKSVTHLNVVEYYLLTNGSLKKAEIIKLCNESGYCVTENELNGFIDLKLYTEIDGIVYYDYEISKTYNEVKERKIADCFFMDMVTGLTTYLFPLMIRDVLHYHWKKDSDLEYFVPHKILLTFMSCEESEKVTKKYLKDINIKLAKKEKEILNIVEDIVKSCIPIWTLGGYSIIEASKIISSQDFESCLKSIYEIDFNKMFDLGDLESDIWDEDLLEDNDALYVLAYVTINGVIGISELEDILKQNHNVKLNKKKIISYAESFNIIHDDKYLYTIQDKEVVSMIKFSHNVTKDYKIVENPYKTLEKYNDTLEKISKIVEEYIVSQEKIFDVIMLLALSPSDADGIKYFIEKEKIRMKKGKNIDELTKKLEKLSEDMPAWMLSGYTEKEFEERKKIK